jgi:hypothetical protein
LARFCSRCIMWSALKLNDVKQSYSGDTM